METISLVKRIIIYIFNAIIYTAIGFASALPFLLILHKEIWIYILIGLSFSIVTSVVLIFLLLFFTGGYTITSFLFKVKVVGVERKRITLGQALIRAFNETIVILAIFDLIYLLYHHTERGVIDRLSDTFVIDLER